MLARYCWRCLASAICVGGIPTILGTGVGEIPSVLRADAPNAQISDSLADSHIAQIPIDSYRMDERSDLSMQQSARKLKEFVVLSVNKFEQFFKHKRR